MEEKNIKIENITNEALGILKNFQCATVERVIQLFNEGQERILIADEVGIGKTMVAKGAIALLTQEFKKNNKDIFKVIYVCSNQSIAKQNIRELDLFNTGHEDIMSTRLSMQHLLIEKSTQHINDNFIQLIALTPQTSFDNKSRQGTVKERALIFCVLKRMAEIKAKGLVDNLGEMLMYKVNSSTWDYYTSENTGNVEKEISECEKKSTNNYPYNIHNIISTEYKTELEKLINYLTARPSKKEGAKDLEHISELRKIFAKISVKQLKPDLVILDEFQNFQFLLSSNEPEIKALTDSFFGNIQSSNANKHTKVLLLSATPYKLYNTLEEIGDTNRDDHYSEFMEVMKFLYKENDRYDEFSSIWEDYSTTLKEVSKNKASILLLKEKSKKAEEAIYGRVCRTERISVMEEVDYIDDSSKKNSLEITENDIKAYLQAAELMDAVGGKFNIEYIKSSPYALSFMNKYKEKDTLRDYFKNNPQSINLANKNLLWINKKKINKYEPLPSANARFNQLKNTLFTKNAELLLWMPPCLPYYKPYGVYNEQEKFSKILLFSSWEMVPRMIGSLISYEEERKTIGKLIEKNKNNIIEQSKYYFNNDYSKNKRKRYPSARLKPSTPAIFSLIFPSETLSAIYNPLEYLQEDIKNIESRIKDSLQEQLNKLEEYFVDKNSNRDNSWYYLAPILLDCINGSFENVVRWINCINEDELQRKSTITTKDNNSKTNSEAEDEITTESKSLLSVINKIKNLCIDNNGNYRKPQKGELGRMPDDLIDIIIALAIASPAVCLQRTLKNTETATRIARSFISYFNSPESTAIVELACSKNKNSSEGSHWLDVLDYCKMGNIQAMIDEYVHMLRKERPIEKMINDIELHFKECLTLHSSPYYIESYNEFCKSVKSTVDEQQQSNKPTQEGKRKRMRTHYAVGFSKGDSNDKNIAHKDNLRNAFNSPFWPFVLASTSIGQEGLDFHLYCRKIMHWNLPSNPVEFEQREGRINRYKCLAIRQNISNEYAKEIKQDEHKQASNDIWDIMFNKAVDERASEDSELIPYWCLGKKQDIKIERLLPLYPISKDSSNYNHLIKKLSLYRLTLGQARQEELLEHIFNNFDEPKVFKELFIDLSPFSHKNKNGNIQ